MTFYIHNTFYFVRKLYSKYNICNNYIIHMMLFKIKTATNKKMSWNCILFRDIIKILFTIFVL